MQWCHRASKSTQPLFAPLRRTSNEHDDARKVQRLLSLVMFTTSGRSFRSKRLACYFRGSSAGPGIYFFGIVGLLFSHTPRTDAECLPPRGTFSDQPRKRTWSPHGVRRRQCSRHLSSFHPEGPRHVQPRSTFIVPNGNVTNITGDRERRVPKTREVWRDIALVSGYEGTPDSRKGRSKNMVSHEQNHE